MNETERQEEHMREAVRGYTTFADCPRCGELHERVLVFELRKPFKWAESDLEYPFWAVCPTYGEPIMIGVMLGSPELMKKPEQQRLF